MNPDLHNNSALDLYQTQGTVRALLQQFAIQLMLKADDSPPFPAAGLSSSGSIPSMQKQFALIATDPSDRSLRVAWSLLRRVIKRWTKRCGTHTSRWTISTGPTGIARTSIWKLGAENHHPAITAFFQREPGRINAPQIYGPAHLRSNIQPLLIRSTFIHSIGTVHEIHQIYFPSCVGLPLQARPGQIA